MATERSLGRTLKEMPPNNEGYLESRHSGDRRPLPDQGQGGTD